MLELIDDELKDLAALALRNAFWLDFSRLVNSYLKASEGLDVDQQMLMDEMTSIYGCKQIDAENEHISILSGKDNELSSHKTILEALESEGATEVYVSGEKVFEKRSGDWMWFYGDKND